MWVKLLGAGAVAGCARETQSPNLEQQVLGSAPSISDAATCSLTPDNPEGPYWRPDAPFRSDLTRGQKGTILTVRGRVTTHCTEPLEAAVLDFWQADAAGRYDNSDETVSNPEDYRLRGRVKVASDGSYQLRTIMPGRYGFAGGGGRPMHIHVRIDVPGRPIFVTQIYFDHDPMTKDHSYVKPSLIATVLDVEGGDKHIDFDFVLPG